jgi:SAM-dependent methyltransferase
MPQVQAMLDRGVSVADVGCGAGKVLILLAGAFPNSRYAGYDIYEPNVARATKRAEEANVAGRVRFDVANAIDSLPAQHDIITTFDVVHDAADPLGLLRSIRKALRPGGRYVALEPRSEERMEDNNDAFATLRYGFSLLYCMTTSLANGGLGLGALGMPESKMRALCKEAGFSDVRLVPLEGSFHNLFEITP